MFRSIMFAVNCMMGNAEYFIKALHLFPTQVLLLNICRKNSSHFVLVHFLFSLPSLAFLSPLNFSILLNMYSQGNE